MPTGIKGFQRKNKIWLGRRHTSETKTKMSVNHLGKNKGIHFSSATEFKKGSVSPFRGKKRQPLSEVTKKKIGVAHKGNQHAKGYKHTDLAKKRIGEANKGKKHYRWNGGIKRGKHDGCEYRQWRSDVFKRDSWTCQTCQVKGVYLEAHHIKSWSRFPKLRYELNNGVALCRECHKLTDNYKGKNKSYAI